LSTPLAKNMTHAKVEFSHSLFAIRRVESVTIMKTELKLIRQKLLSKLLIMKIHEKILLSAFKNLIYWPVIGFLDGTSKYCQNKNVKNEDLLSMQTRAKYSYMDSTGHLTRSTTACINNNYYCYWFCLATKPTTTKNKKVKHCQIIFKINFNWYSEKRNIPFENI
jgi:hypothetical protein